MKVKISATFQGNCDLCKKVGKVFSVGDEDTHDVVTICDRCSRKNGSMSLSDLVKAHGKRDENAFEPGVRYEKTAAG